MTTQQKKNNTAGIYLVLFLITIAPFCSHYFLKPVKSKNGHVGESFDPALLRLNTTHKLIAYIDSTYHSKNYNVFDTLAYIDITSETIKNRFHHGLSHYTVSDNWIAALSGKLFWSHLSAIVSSDDILKFPEGLCSQQTIVFMDVLKEKGINYRLVGLGRIEGPGHFLAEVKYNGAWHLYDVTMEPKWNKISQQHMDFETYRQFPDSLYTIYDSKFTRNDFNKVISKVSYGKENVTPAKKMRMFHFVTLIIAWLLPVMFLTLFVFALRKQKKTTNEISAYVSEDKKTEELAEV